MYSAGGNTITDDTSYPLSPRHPPEGAEFELLASTEAMKSNEVNDIDTEVKVIKYDNEIKAVVTLEDTEALSIWDIHDYRSLVYTLTEDEYIETLQITPSNLDILQDERMDSETGGDDDDGWPADIFLIHSIETDASTSPAAQGSKTRDSHLLGSGVAHIPRREPPPAPPYRWKGFPSLTGIEDYTFSWEKTTPVREKQETMGLQEGRETVGQHVFVRNEDTTDGVTRIYQELDEVNPKEGRPLDPSVDHMEHYKEGEGTHIMRMSNRKAEYTQYIAKSQTDHVDGEMEGGASQRRTVTQQPRTHSDDLGDGEDGVSFWDWWGQGRESIDSQSPGCDWSRVTRSSVTTQTETNLCTVEHTVEFQEFLQFQRMHILAKKEGRHLSWESFQSGLSHDDAAEAGPSSTAVSAIVALTSHEKSSEKSKRNFKKGKHSLGNKGEDATKKVLVDACDSLVTSLGREPDTDVGATAALDVTGTTSVKMEDGNNNDRENRLDMFSKGEVSMETGSDGAADAGKTAFGSLIMERAKKGGYSGENIKATQHTGHTKETMTASQAEDAGLSWNNELGDAVASAYAFDGLHTGQHEYKLVDRSSQTEVSGGSGMLVYGHSPSTRAAAWTAASSVSARGGSGSWFGLGMGSANTNDAEDMAALVALADDVAEASDKSSNEEACASFCCRVCCAALPLQLLMMMLLGLACLFPTSEDEAGCILGNKFLSSGSFVLRYRDGPPPF